MAKIKNDPSKYVKRSDLSSPKKEDGFKAVCAVNRTEKDFLAATIDDRFYVDFGKPSKKGSSAKTSGRA